MTSVLAAIPWDPYLTGLLATLIGVIVLCGSVYLLLTTNVGGRLGFLIAFTGLAGWMFLIGIIWWIYAIGLIGDLPEWNVKEVLTGDGIAFSQVDDVQELPVVEAGTVVDDTIVPSDWEYLDDDNPLRGEISSIADEVLVSDPAIVALAGASATTSDYLTTAAFQTGGDAYPELFGYDGKPLGWFHTPNHAVVQVQPALPAPPPDANVAPPPREPDLSAPVLSVVMVRDMGSVRFPPFLVTLASGIAFGVGAWLLHRRDHDLWAAQDADAKAASA